MLGLASFGEGSAVQCSAGWQRQQARPYTRQQQLPYRPSVLADPSTVPAPPALLQTLSILQKSALGWDGMEFLRDGVPHLAQRMVEHQERQGQPQGGAPSSPAAAMAALDATMVRG